MQVSAISVLTVLLVADYAGIASAQATTLPFDHVHLAVPDQFAAVEWYRKNLGGQLPAPLRRWRASNPWDVHSI
jgi:hypothetical protein